MTSPCRTWWRNCASETDSEMLKIDRMEDRIAPLSPGVSRVRELISSLELCHHKTERWVDNIIEAIAAEETEKGLGTRPPDQSHPAESIWQNACTALTAWCAEGPEASADVSVGHIPATRMLAALGERTPLKDWQVQRVIEKIRESIHWPQSLNDPAAQYRWILLSGGEYESFYRD